MTMSFSMARNLLLMAIVLHTCFQLCCDAFTQQQHVPFKAFSRTSTSYRRFPSAYNQSMIRKKHSKPSCLSKQSFASTDDDIDGPTGKRRRWLRFPVVERMHEKLISLVFLGLSTTILHIAHIYSQSDGLPPINPGKLLIMAETFLALSWSSMIVAISFLEAWTKFRAPFLKKYIAVDVGRHVFAALNSAELGIISSFWLYRTFLCYQVHQVLGGGLLHKSRTYYEQFSFILPVVATISLLSQVLFIAPKLYRRAKRKILDGFDEALPSVKIALTKAEQVALADITEDFRFSNKIPMRLWHSLYALLEIVKIGCLNAFVILCWLKVLQ